MIPSIILSAYNHILFEVPTLRKYFWVYFEFIFIREICFIFLISYDIIKKYRNMQKYQQLCKRMHICTQIYTSNKRKTIQKSTCKKQSIADRQITFTNMFNEVSQSNLTCNMVAEQVLSPGY